MRNLAILILCSLTSLAQAQNSSGYSVPTSGTGLTVFIGSGTTTTVNGAIVTWPGALVNVSANVATYIYVDSTGHVGTSTNTSGLLQPGVCDSGFASQSFPIAKVTANFSQVQTVIDCRTTFNLAGAGSSAVTSVFGRTGAITAQAGDYTFNQIAAGSNTNALTMGTGGTFAPLGAGQIVSTLGYMQPGISAPSISTSTTGGNIAASHAIHVVVSYNNALGETLPSVDVSVTTGAGGTNSVTVTAPTLPAGYTSYTVYDYDNNITANGPYKQQTASAACVAITGNCVIGVIGTGSNPLTVPTAFPTPPNAQAFNGMYGEQPSVWTPDANGNYTPWIALDWSTCAVGNFSPCGTPTFLKQTFFTDYGNGISNVSYGSPITAESGSNCMVCINHLPNQFTTANNQDRALWVSAVTPTTYSNTSHGIEGIQTEVDFNCNGCGFTAPDSELSTASFQMADLAATNYTAGGAGTNGIRVNLFKSGNGSANAGSYSVIRSEFTINNATAYPAGSTAIVYRAGCKNAGLGIITNLECVGMYMVPNGGAGSYSGNRPSLGTVMVYFSNASGNTPGTGDAFLRNDNHAWPSLLNGPTGMTQIINTDMQALPISASATWTGSLGTSKLASSVNLGASVACSGGASTYTYQFIFKDALGGAVGSVSQNATSCTNPLTAGNPVTINVNSSTTLLTLGGIGNQVSSIDIYRTAGPMGTGKVGTLSCNTNFIFFGCNSFSDTGLTADGGTAPTTNTTGQLAAAGYFNAQTNHVQLTSDFTSAANTSLQTITGLSWNLDPAAKNYSFHCSLMYSQATAAVSMQFGIQVATANPTNVNAKGRVDTSTSAVTSGVLSGLTTTTATSIVTFTPSASATVFGADLDGSIEVPANDAGNVVNIMVQTSNSADLPTVKRGSYCYLY